MSDEKLLKIGTLNVKNIESNETYVRELLQTYDLLAVQEHCLSWCFSYVCSICACLVLSVSSSSWCLGRAVVCDCGTPWSFLLPFFSTFVCR